LPLCRLVQLGDGVQPLTSERRHAFLRAQDALAAEGLRVLAVASRAVPEAYDREHLEEGLTLAGLLGLEDPPRPEVPAAVARGREAGIRVVMVTGDHPHTAAAIARQVGLVRDVGPRVFTGEELGRMGRAQLQLALDLPEIVFARVSAEQKLRIVQALQAKGHVVAVTGDGVNDAPALRNADIGIATGRSGTDVARAAADMVLLDDNFASIVAAVEEGRAVFANLRKFLTYVLTHYVPELVPYLAFVLLKVPPARASGTGPAGASVPSWTASSPRSRPTGRTRQSCTGSASGARNCVTLWSSWPRRFPSRSEPCFTRPWKRCRTASARSTTWQPRRNAWNTRSGRPGNPRTRPRGGDCWPPSGNNSSKRAGCSGDGVRRGGCGNCATGSRQC
jgi:phosphoglycolate phosphatase-like HAD superfamily hydrolase